MNKDQIALVAIVLAFLAVESIEHISGAVGAPVITTHWQISSTTAVATPQNGVVSMIWLMADDGKLEVCEAADKGSLNVTCSRPVIP